MFDTPVLELGDQLAGKKKSTATKNNMHTNVRAHAFDLGVGDISHFQLDLSTAL